MRELRNCDFCDADAVGAFAIVPPELEPTEAEQRRVVCCPDCRDRLEGLLEPLLARLREGDETGADGGVDGRDAERSDGGGSVVATTDGSTADRSRDASPNATVSGAGEADASEADSEAPSGLEDGITFERDERTIDTASTADADRPTDAAETDGSETDDEPPSTGDSDRGSGTDGSDDSSQAMDDPDDPDRSDARGATEPDSSTRPPAAYAKVVRLLRNREFPMQRSAVEELAAGAYDLENREVEAIVDHAIEEGEFVEKRGLLRRP